MNQIDSSMVIQGLQLYKDQIGLKFWSEKLKAGCEESLTNTWGTGSSNRSVRSVESYFEEDEFVRLHQLTKGNSYLQFAFLTATLGLLASRHRGVMNIFIGTGPFLKPPADRATGYPLFLHVDASDHLDFRTLLLKAKTEVTETVSHQAIDYADLLEVHFQNLPEHKLLSDIFINVSAIQDVAQVMLLKWTVLFDFKIDASSRSFVVHFNELAVDRQTVLRFIQCFKTIVRQLLLAPEGFSIRLGAISLIDRTEYEQSSGHGIQEVTFPSDNLITLIERRCVTQGARIALVGENMLLSYSCVGELISRLGAYLQDQGVGEGTIVGLSSRRSVETLLMIYGILKAGGAYLPIPDSYPASRRAYVAADSGMAFWFQAPGSQTPEGIVSDCKILDYETGAAFEGDQAAAQISAASVAYVLYTSGTTGRPKGVVINHNAVVNRLDWMQRHYALGADDVLIQKTPLAFDVSVWEVFWPLMMGSQLYVLPEGQERDPGRIGADIDRYGVTVIHFVPSMLEVFLRSQEGESPKGTLQQVYCSGEALLPSQVSLFRSVLGTDGPRLTNLYGPTEATVDVSYLDCTGEYDRAAVPIGHPIQNSALYVIDKNLNLQPPGVIGELAIAGICLGRGYLNNPELTHARYTRASWLPSSRLYLTGDRVRVSGDGNIDYLGRFDDQVKLRGQRIELGEIRAVLLRQAGITQAVVVMSKDSAEQAYLCAYVVSGGPVDVDGLRRGLSGDLPAYMIPSYFVQVVAIPLTAHGKADVRKLMEQSPIAPVQKQFVPPQNQIEAQLLDVWMTVLGHKTISVTDNFFEIGGNSLRLIEVEDRLKAKGLQASVMELFEFATIRKLADHIHRRNQIHQDQPATSNLSSSQDDMYENISTLTKILDE